MVSLLETKNGILEVDGILMGLTLIAVLLRLCARRRQQVAFKADDVFAVVSLFSFWGAAIVTFVMIQNMAIGHSLTPAAGSEFSSKAQIAWDVLSLTSIACTKLSALFFYRRVFCVRGIVNWFSTLVNVAIVIVVIWLVVFQFLTGFQCGTHFSALWDGTYLQYCTISEPFLEGLSISDFILDFLILGLPIPCILQLNTTSTRKVAIIAVFFTALIGVGAACARMVEYITLISTGPSYFIHNDQERTVTKAIYFAMLEAGISLVAVNLPSFWFLFTSITPDKILRSIRSVLSIASLGSNRGAGGTDDLGDESTVAVRCSRSSASTSPPSLGNKSSYDDNINDLEAGQLTQSALDTMDDKTMHVQNTVVV